MIQKPFIHLYRQNIKTSSWNAAFAIEMEACSAGWSGEQKGEEVAIRRFKQQVDFINTLYCPKPARAFAIRYLVHPHPTSFSAGKIDVIFLGVVTGKNQEEAQQHSQNLCREVLALLGGMMPDYAWSVVTEKKRFFKLWEPFPWEQAYVAEIRRREDQVRLETVRPRPVLGRGRAQTPPAWNEEDSVYFVHPFNPKPAATFGRLIRTMLLHNGPLLYQAAIQPVWLTTQEEEALVAEIGKCEGYAQRRETLTRESLLSAQTIHEQRAEALCEGLLQQLLRLQDAPFLLNITLASPLPLPSTLLEATGVEITVPVGNQLENSSYELTKLQMGGYDVVLPRNKKEMRLACHNARFITFNLWGESLASRPLSRVRHLVDAYEAAGAFRFPVATSEGLAGLEVRTARWFPLSREIAALKSSASPRQKLLLGENRYLGLREPVFITEKDRRQHLYIVGQTGTGKTTLLKTMIINDMEAGQGLAVIDPHGDLFDELMMLVPEQRIKDVVLLDPNDMDFPVGLNMLECPREDQRHFIVREMKGIMERLLRDEYGNAAGDYAGPVFYQHMQMNMLLTMSDPKNPGTLLEFYEIFQHEDYWKKWLPLKWKDPQLKRWVKNNLPSINYLERYRSEMTWGEYLSSRFEDFVFDPRLRLIFGQKRSTIDLRRIMDEGKILLVNLAKGELSEVNARFLGMILITKFLMAAMTRTDVPVQERRIFYLYVDEFQSLATQSFITLLSEARKFGLGLILANQFLSQIADPRIIQSIFGNVGTLVSFRVGQQDAEILEPHFDPYFSKFNLSNLPNWHACVKTTVQGQVVSPFTLHTVLPKNKAKPEVAEKVRTHSRYCYGRKRKEVENEIQKSLKKENNNVEDLFD